jgi:hypothetical protein
MSPGCYSLMCFPKRWIETPIEANQHGGVQRADLPPAPIDPLQVQVDRFSQSTALPARTARVSKSTCVV